MISGGKTFTKQQVISAWCMYDWANSAFATTIMAAVLPVYYSQVAGSTLPSKSTATAYWSLGLSLSLLVVAILSPILGTVSDVARRKKRPATGGRRLDPSWNLIESTTPLAGIDKTPAGADEGTRLVQSSHTQRPCCHKKRVDQFGRGLGRLDQSCVVDDPFSVSLSSAVYPRLLVNL